MDIVTEFKVKTPVFEGPLDVLLTLIEKRKLLINDISLAKVSDDYLEYVKTLDKFPMADTAQFIVIASTLLLIKSKSLLPGLDLTDDETKDIYDLEQRLIVYKQIKEASVNISKIFGANVAYLPLERKGVEIVWSPDNTISSESLLDSVKSVLQNLPKKKVIPQTVVKKIISLEEMIERLTDRIQKTIKTTFRELTSQSKDNKVEIIVGFLAMLELVKQGMIQVRQESDFADIHIETDKVTTPYYN